MLWGFILAACSWATNQDLQQLQALIIVVIIQDTVQITFLALCLALDQSLGPGTLSFPDKSARPCASLLRPEVSTSEAEDEALIDDSEEWFPPEVNQGDYQEG